VLDGWNIDIATLPGYGPLPEGWPGPDVELFEIPDSPLAYVIYNLFEVDMYESAGSIAVFRDEGHPVQIFAPDRWVVYPARGVIRCDREANTLLIEIANTSETLEKHALVDLRARRFAPVFIPCPGYTFTRIDVRHFAMIPPRGDGPPYRRSYLLDSHDLRWFDYTARDGFDEVIVPSQMYPPVWQHRDAGRQRVWSQAYRMAVEKESTSDAKAIADRVLDRIDFKDLLISVPVEGTHAVQVDGDRLRALVAEACAEFRGDQRGTQSR
jgi:hypothetical protein